VCERERRLVAFLMVKVEVEVGGDKKKGKSDRGYLTYLL
jgi:hypothetical protein